MEFTTVLIEPAKTMTIPKDLVRRVVEAMEHGLVCDFPDEIDFRCDGCNALRSVLAELRAIEGGK